MNHILGSRRASATESVGSAATSLDLGYGGINNSINGHCNDQCVVCAGGVHGVGVAGEAVDSCDHRTYASLLHRIYSLEITTPRLSLVPVSQELENQDCKVNMSTGGQTSSNGACGDPTCRARDESGDVRCDCESVPYLEIKRYLEEFSGRECSATAESAAILKHSLTIREECICGGAASGGLGEIKNSEYPDTSFATISGGSAFCSNNNVHPEFRETTCMMDSVPCAWAIRVKPDSSGSEVESSESSSFNDISTMSRRGRVVGLDIVGVVCLSFPILAMESTASIYSTSASLPSQSYPFTPSSSLISEVDILNPLRLNSHFTPPVSPRRHSTTHASSSAAASASAAAAAAELSKDLSKVAISSTERGNVQIPSPRLHVFLDEEYVGLGYVSLLSYLYYLFVASFLKTY